jgi:hypothetical protein
MRVFFCIDGAFLCVLTRQMACIFWVSLSSDIAWRLRFYLWAVITKYKIYKKIWVIYKQINLFLTVTEAGKATVKALAGLVFGEGPVSVFKIMS